MPAALALPQGATSATIRIPIAADNLVEGAENFEVELTAVANAPYDLGAPAAAAITITDDDRADLSITSHRSLAVTETDQDFTQNITVNINPKMEITSAVNVAVDWNNGSMVRARPRSRCPRARPA